MVVSVDKLVMIAELKGEIAAYERTIAELQKRVDAKMQSIERISNNQEEQNE